MLLADAAAATGMTISDVAPAVSAVSSLGFAIWFAWYTTVYTIPEKEKRHQEQLDKLSEFHQQQIDKLSEFHQQQIDKLSEFHQQQIDRMTELHANTVKSIVDELRANRDAFDRWKNGQRA